MAALTHRRETGNMRFQSWVGFVPTILSLGEQKLENKCHKDKQAVFPLTISCSTSQFRPLGMLAVTSAGQQAAALSFTVAHSDEGRVVLEEIQGPW